MEINIKGTPEEIKELLQVITSDKEQQDYQKKKSKNEEMRIIPTSFSERLSVKDLYPNFFDLENNNKKNSDLPCEGLNDQRSNPNFVVLGFSIVFKTKDEAIAFADLQKISRSQVLTIVPAGQFPKTVYKEN